VKPSPVPPFCLALLLAASFAFAQSPSVSDTAAAVSGSDTAPSISGTAVPLPDLSQFHTADDLWAQIQKLEEGPGANANAQDVLSLLHQLTAATAEFETRYPKDPRRWDARLVSLKYNSMLASAESQQPDTSKIESSLKEIAAAPDASHDAKVEARINLIGMHVDAAGQDTLAPDVDAEIVAFLHDFPNEPDDAPLQRMRLESLQKSDPDKAAKFLDTLLKDPNPAVAAMAQSQVQMRDLMKKPFDLQFTATDGTKVDMKNLRGKVVVIDFWATWCAPCMESLPDEVKLYNQFHKKGLEIIGISLDQDKSLLDAVTKSQGVAWPQYFDGKGPNNDIATRYGIETIPRVFLVDQKGMVVDPDALDGLADKVQQLLTQ